MPLLWGRHPRRSPRRVDLNGRLTMAKSQDKRRSTKKEAQKSLKEKRRAKKERKAEKA